MVVKLKNMTFMELIAECIAKGISYEGEDAEALRSKLSSKKSDKD